MAGYDHSGKASSYLKQTLDLAGQAERVRCPVYALHGALDPLIPPEQVDRLRKALAQPSGRRVRYSRGRGSLLPQPLPRRASANGGLADRAALLPPKLMPVTVERRFRVARSGGLQTVCVALSHAAAVMKEATMKKAIIVGGSMAGMLAGNMLIRQGWAGRHP